jgi:hypothetical protein
MALTANDYGHTDRGMMKLAELMKHLRSTMAACAIVCVFMSALGLHVHDANHRHAVADNHEDGHLDHGDHIHAADQDDDDGHHPTDGLDPQGKTDLDSHDTCWHSHGPSVVSSTIASLTTPIHPPVMMGKLGMIRDQSRPDSYSRQIEPAPDKRFL